MKAHNPNTSFVAARKAFEKAQEEVRALKSAHKSYVNKIGTELRNEFIAQFGEHSYIKTLSKDPRASYVKRPLGEELELWVAVGNTRQGKFINIRKDINEPAYGNMIKKIMDEGGWTTMVTLEDHNPILLKFS